MTTQSLSPQVRPQAQRVSHGAGFWIVAAAFTVLMAFGTAPTPLWPLYQARDGFGPTTVTIAIGLMASTATAYLADLHREEHPDAPGSAVPGVVSTAANLGGLALGPLLVGVLAQWVRSP